MKLLEQQKQLADLYTNPSVRKEYFQAGHEKLDENEVTVFAEGLLHKRRNAVRGLMPLSFLYKKELFDLFLIYASTHAIQGYHLKHQMDALAFSNYLEKEEGIQKNNYFKQILKYERFCIRQSMRGRFLIFFSHYRIASATDETIHYPKQLKGRVMMVCFRIFSNSPWKRSVFQF